MLKTYGQLLAHCRSTAAWAIILAGLAAVTEGVALASLMPVLNVFGSASSFPYEQWFDAVGLPSDPGSILWVCLILFVLLAAGAALSRAAADILSILVKTKVETMMRQQMTRALLEIDWAHFITLKQGDISKAMVIEGMQVGTGAQHVVSAYGAILAALCYLAVSLAISIELTLIALLFGIFGSVVYILGVRGVSQYADSLSRIVTDIGDRTSEIFGNLKYFRSIGQESEAKVRSEVLFHEYASTFFKSQLFSPLLRSGIESIAAVFVAGFLFYQIGLNKGSIAEVIVFLAVFYRMAPRLLHVQNSLFQARTYMTWLDTYDQRLSFAQRYRQDVDGSGCVRFEEAIIFDQVSFTYPGVEEPVIDNVCLDIRKGECIAFVGPSGAGKSTLVDLLTGLLVPQKGDILLDGEDLRAVNKKDWRGRIGIVMQESLILHATVAENVAFGAGQINQEQIIRALEQAHAMEFVDNLPDGIDTVVAERGARLSGGQRQRLAIARALYRRPDLLILDEATSALDGHSEERIKKVIEQMQGQMTIVLITHRLKTVTMSDRIIVIRDGKIVESGDWQQLISMQGQFTEMARMQGLA